jgi:hypothetical protein
MLVIGAITVKALILATVTSIVSDYLCEGHSATVNNNRSGVGFF